MVPRHVKLNELFVKKSVCKGARTASLGMALMPLLGRPENFCSDHPLYCATSFFPMRIFVNLGPVFPCLFLNADVNITGS